MRPVLFEFGPITLYSYGLMLALGFLIATLLGMQSARLAGIPATKILDLALFILITGIIGSRVLYVVLNWPDFSASPFDVFLLNRGGLAIYGGFLFAISTSIFFVKRLSLPFWKTADLISPYIALAQSIGRIGCFFNGCCYGKPTDSFLGMYFPFYDYKIHPTQIYSSFAMLLLFVTLKIRHKSRRFDGEVFLSYLVIYSVFRFFIEILRGDSGVFIFGLTIFQCISVALFAVGIILYAVRRKKPCRITLSR